MAAGFLPLIPKIGDSGAGGTHSSAGYGVDENEGEAVTFARVFLFEALTSDGTKGLPHDKTSYPATDRRGPRYRT